MAKKVDHTHGDRGLKPSDSLNFQRGDKPDPEVFDWFWSEVPAAINDHADELDTIDVDDDGKVNAAENVTSTYKSNDIDSDGDGVVDKADNVESADLTSPITIPATATNNQNESVVVGTTNTEIQEDTSDFGNRQGVAIGHAARVHRDADGSSQSSIAIGYATLTEGERAVAIGHQAEAKRKRSVAIGEFVSTSNKNEIKLGGSTYNTLIEGDFNVSGSKNFVIDHPSKNGYDLKHSSYEGPVSGGLVYNETVEVSNVEHSLNTDLPDYVVNGDFGKNWTTHVTASNHFGNGYVDTETWTLHVEKSGSYEVTIFGERDDEGALSKGGDVMEKPKGEKWDGSPRSYEINYDDVNGYDTVRSVKQKYDHNESTPSTPCKEALTEYIVIFTNKGKVTLEPSELNSHGGTDYVANIDEVIEVAKDK